MNLIFKTTIFVMGLTAAGGLATPALAQQAATDTGCQVRGLDPNGDGFLAIRTGPGTKYRQIGSLHNGDFAVPLEKCSGNWCYARTFQRGNGQRLRLTGGWIYKRYCLLYP